MKENNIDIDQIKNIIAHALDCPVDSIDLSTGLSKHENWDSLGQIQIISELEEFYGVKVNESNVVHFTTIKGIYEYLKGVQ